MSIGTAIFLSTVLVLAYHFAYHNPKFRKPMLWAGGIGLFVLMAVAVWVWS